MIEGPKRAVRQIPACGARVRCRRRRGCAAAARSRDVRITMLEAIAIGLLISLEATADGDGGDISDGRDHEDGGMFLSGSLASKVI
jgi:hypothetical protein